MRKRQKDRHLPPCVYLKHGAYYLVRNNAWVRLGSDLGKALAEYGRLHGTPSDGGMRGLIQDALPVITRGRAKNTQDQYQVAARKLQEILQEFTPQQVTQKTIVQLRRGLADTPNMANRCLTVLRMVFDYALEEQLIDNNPCVGVKRLPEKKRDRLIDRSEFDRIRAAAPPRLQLMMDIAYLTGQRLMDVVQIRRSDLSSEGIYFQQDKTDAKLIVSWTPQLREAVAQAKALGGKVNSMSLFHTSRGGPPAYRTVYDQWVRACQVAGMEDTDLRDLRAMAATEAKRQGKDATALLGHASSAMTQRYLRGREVPVVDGPEMKAG
jgi:integrase